MTSSSSIPLRVYVILGIGLVSVSSSPLLIRFASEAPGEVIAMWRTVLGVLLLAPIALPRIRPEVRQFSRRDVLFVVASGVLLGFHFITWIESLYHTSVASATVLVTTSPIFLAVLGYVLLKERLKPRTAVAGLVAVAGAVLIGVGDASGTQASNTLLGNSLALGAAVLVSGYLIIGRVVRQKTSWLAYVFPVYTVVALTTFGYALLQGTPFLGYSAGFYGLCLLMAIGPHLLGHGAINYALRYITAAVIGLLTLLEPVVSSVAAYFLFDELPGVLALVGMIVVLLALITALWPARRQAETAVTSVEG